MTFQKEKCLLIGVRFGPPCPSTHCSSAELWATMLPWIWSNPTCGFHQGASLLTHCRTHGIPSLLFSRKKIIVCILNHWKEDLLESMTMRHSSPVQVCTSFRISNSLWHHSPWRITSGLWQHDIAGHLWILLNLFAISLIVLAMR